MMLRLGIPRPTLRLTQIYKQGNAPFYPTPPPRTYQKSAHVWRLKL